MTDETPLSLLIIDHRPEWTDAVRHALALVPGLHVWEATTIDLARAALQDHEFAVIVIGHSELNPVWHYVLDEIDHHVPLESPTRRILLTKEGLGEHEVVDAYHRGIDDIILMPLNPPTFSAQIQALMRTYRRLRDLVEANAALEDLSRAAQAASKTKTAFLANMSHELRTPLNGILGTAELLGRTELSPLQKKFTDIILTSGAGLLSLISDILDISKIEAGRTEVNPESIELDLFLPSVLEPHLPRAAQNGIDLLLRVAQNTPAEFVSDPMLLRQILSNLIANAVKFTHQGQVLVTVGVLREGRLVFEIRDSGIGIPAENIDEIFSLFTQADLSTTRKYGGTGLGLAITRQLTEMLGGVISVRSAVGEGSIFTIDLPIVGVRPFSLPVGAAGQAAVLLMPTGMRCSVLAANLEDMGWDTIEMVDPALFDPVMRDRPNVTIFATPDILLRSLNDGQRAALSGRGHSRLVELRDIAPTEVADDVYRALRPNATLYYIYQRSDLLALNRQAAHVPTKNEGDHAASVTGDGVDILVVEDDSINAFIVNQMLVQLGHRVTHATNGEEALAYCERQVFDLILMDCMMPIMDGYEASRRIRSGSTSNSTRPIIAVTASAQKEDRDRCLAAGMTDYLTKPFKLAHLQEILNRYL